MAIHTSFPLTTLKKITNLSEKLQFLVAPERIKRYFQRPNRNFPHKTYEQRKNGRRTGAY